MKILSYKAGHDGHVAYLDKSKLQFSIEAEKDSWPRYEVVTPSLNLRAMEYVDTIPDVVAISGWVKGFHSVNDPVEGGYYGEGVNTIVDRTQNFLGKEVRLFSSSHERSHILGAYGMSPFPQGQACYALIWEGSLGCFYHIDENVHVTKIGSVMADPGNKYAFLYALADPSFPIHKGFFRYSDAGKLMALVSYGKPNSASDSDKELIDFILSQKAILLDVDKGQLRDSPYFNIGVESEQFKNLARNFSDTLFQRFHDFAKEHLTEKLPLLIAGGCGLNCDWNSEWHNTGLFSDIFIPPCTNDSGSAIGTAIDAQRHYTGEAKINWSVYAGEAFVHDKADLSEYDAFDLDYAQVSDFLKNQNVIAWVQGKYEIGPRALGNRSLIAAPFTKEMHARLNKIKNREGFRPIAPICLETDMDAYFENHGPSPYMLHFQKVKTDALKTITHVDGSARAQTVSDATNPEMTKLLMQFKSDTGYGVLCNTSLNFNGTGFINRMSDLVKYATNAGLDGFVVEDKFYKKK
ncbi:hydroxymethyl cephem carbamoyltransferase [Epibacterium ulvae]|uniref:Hydroxymethyl cephem carbamoyltransferase n=1 Tax=Epibacterium ulvae TaxID=1156985 RepID=A0A1G5QGI9_9RHOB|nr:carbamoyltransferase C-terminal domain-containing protein [Epibacterium ulvae]SCZ60995.1 hydroxymethyl cephem carbamoyltransferase [Epibacterium ulvae]